MIASSVNAPAKKDGAGGGYTWGSALDDPTDFVPVSSQVAGPNIITTTAPECSGLGQPVSPFGGNLMDNFQYPPLGGSLPIAQPAASGVVQVPTLAPGARAWPASSAPRIALTTESIRCGTSDIFDSTHPRSKFAAKPITTVTSAPVQAAPVAIDWSGAGVQDVNRSLVAAGNPAHLGLYQQAQSARIPTQYLRPATAPVQANLNYRVQAAAKPNRSVVTKNYAQGSRGQR
jgi:hypothetical protein